MIFFKKIGKHKIKRLRKKKGFWKHVKTPRSYRIAKKHQKKRGKFLLKARLQYKKHFKRLQKIGRKLNLLVNEKPLYPQKAIVRIYKIETYFYDLQKNFILKIKNV